MVKQEVKHELTEEQKAVLKRFKPGQKKETPPPASGTRVFYESLYRQRPESLIALKWCLEYGVLPKGDCEKLLIELEKRKKEKKLRMDKIARSPQKKEKSMKVKKSKKSHKHRRAAEFDDGEYEDGVGTTNL